MTDIIKFALTKTPLLISTTINHYLNGPPQPSWDLKFHLIFELLRSASAQTIEQSQALTARPIPVPAGVMINESKIDNRYRHEAQVHLDKILKPYEHVLDTEWKDLKEDGVAAEWVQVPDDGWEKREIRKTILYLHGGAYYLYSMKGAHRNIISKLAKKANARVFAIDYRLAPQNQFPAGLQDALAAYLYLLNPPKDAGFEPLNPKNIVIIGDSAGGGLSMALGLALRDAGLPPCAGIVGLSSWVDLTASMPSTSDDKCTDFLANLISKFQHAEYPVSTMQSLLESQILIEYKEKAAALTARIKKQNLGPKIWHDSFDKPEGRMHLYVPNEGLAIPYVSPMLAESLGNLPPLLLIAGDEERLRDETIYFAHKSAEPTKYKGPSYNAGKFEKTSFQTPTNVTLEIYEEMPHVFQIFEHINSAVSFKRIIEFINRVINTPNELLPSSYNRINSNGEFGPLNEHDKEILNWENIGIVPNIRRSKIKVISHRPMPKHFMYIALFAIIIYYVQVFGLFHVKKY